MSMTINNDSSENLLQKILSLSQSITSLNDSNNTSDIENMIGCTNNKDTYDNKSGSKLVSIIENLNSPKTFLPKEGEEASRKRSHAIQELLANKKARLENAKSRKSSTKSLSDIFSKDKCGDSNTVSSADTESNDGSDVSQRELLQNVNTLAITNLLQTPNDISPQEFLAKLFSSNEQVNVATPNNDNGVLRYPDVNVPENVIFAKVPGRLSLLANCKKYEVSVGEIKRRLLGPECFNFSLLGALLRRAKLPQKSDELVSDLAKIGLSIARGRRRHSNLTLMSALCETEALKLAKDLGKTTKTHFPSKAIAEDAFKRFSLLPDPDNKLKEERIKKMRNAIEVFQEMSEYMLSDRSPILDHETTPILPEELQSKFTNYSMLTHGLGVPVLLIGLQSAMDYVTSSLSFFEGSNFPNNIDLTANITTNNINMRKEE
uniref:Transcription factor AP-2 (inferred by orthology to a D. melanogaster protein) n=1 Tax=Strongyloides venezuelensis TaxID=75913 RepID=A0A0K0F0U4_STRVS